MKVNLFALGFVAMKASKQTARSSIFLFLLIINAVFPSESLAHRSAENVIDNCRIRVGFERIHFTAYTPELTRNREYCQAIPELGLTNLVFDYEGKKLRNITVEFEVTKEPEGTRVYHQEPKKIKTGTVNGSVDFRKHGAGKYLAHVTIVHNDKKLDTHLPFTVGIESDARSSSFIEVLIFFGVILTVLYVVIRILNAKENRSSGTRDSKF